MRVSDWSSDVCSSDLGGAVGGIRLAVDHGLDRGGVTRNLHLDDVVPGQSSECEVAADRILQGGRAFHPGHPPTLELGDRLDTGVAGGDDRGGAVGHAHDELRDRLRSPLARSEEHTSELQSLMRTSYAAFCLKKNNKATRTC